MVLPCHETTSSFEIVQYSNMELLSYVGQCQRLRHLPYGDGHMNDHTVMVMRLDTLN